MKRKAKITPRCQTSKGCPIYEIAADPEVNLMCTEFISARQAAQNSRSEILLNKFYEKWKLTEFISLAMGLENVWIKYTNIQSERQRQTRGR